MIEVNKRSDLEFVVFIKEGNTRTEHVVILDENYYQYLTGGKIEKEELIKKSFEFLLKRESKESILSKFNVRIIKTYFSEYEEEIKINGK